MYALVAMFDSKTEKLIRKIWKGLEDNNISYYASEVKDRVPHMTIASYNDLSVEPFIDRLETYYDNKDSIPISFQTVGSFLNTTTLFYTPTVTAALLNFHEEHHQHFKEYNDDSHSLYLPSKWVPHCTLTNRLSREKLKDAYQYCLQMKGSLEGEINRVGLIRLESQNHAPVIFTKNLY